MARLVNTSGRSILVPPGISVKPTIHASIPTDIGAEPVGSEDGSPHADFRLEYSTQTGRYEIAAFGIDRRDAKAEVTGAVWRTVRVHWIIRLAISFGLPMWTWPISDLWAYSKNNELNTLPDFSESRSDDGLLLAALVYRIAQISNDTPALAVAETLHLKQRTATNWIQRAKAAGYFDNVDHQADARRIAEEIKSLNPIPTLSPEEVSERIAQMRAAREARNGHD